MQFSNILCHKIVQNYKLCMLQILFKNNLIKYAIIFSDVHVYLSTPLIMVSQQISMNHSLCITHRMNSNDIFIIIINTTCAGLHVSVHVIQCIHIPNSVNMLVMCNEELYCSHVCCLFRPIPCILTLHYYFK